MIVDAHCHLVDEKWLPRGWWEGLAKVALPVAQKLGMRDVTSEMLIQNFFPSLYFDPTGERQLQVMEEAGIDRVVLLFTQEEIQAVLGGNAARLLGIS